MKNNKSMMQTNEKNTMIIDRNNSGYLNNNVKKEILVDNDKK